VRVFPRPLHILFLSPSPSGRGAGVRVIIGSGVRDIQFPYQTIVVSYPAPYIGGYIYAH